MYKCEEILHPKEQSSVLKKESFFLYQIRFSNGAHRETDKLSAPSTVLGFLLLCNGLIL